MSNEKLLESIQKIVDKSIQENVEKVVERVVEKVVNKKMEIIDKRFDQIDKKFKEVDKKFEEVNRRIDEVHKRIDYYHKPLEPSKTELMPLKSVISLSVLHEPTLDWMEEMYDEILRQVKSKKFKGVWINTPKQWYQQTFNLFHEVDDKNLAKVTTWNEINLP